MCINRPNLSIEKRGLFTNFHKNKVRKYANTQILLVDKGRASHEVNLSVVGLKRIASAIP